MDSARAPSRNEPRAQDPGRTNHQSQISSGGSASHRGSPDPGKARGQVTPGSKPDRAQQGTQGGVNQREILPVEFFHRTAPEVARDLLGAVLISDLGPSRSAGMRRVSSPFASATSWPRTASISPTRLMTLRMICPVMSW